MMSNSAMPKEAAQQFLDHIRDNEDQMRLIAGMSLEDLTSHARNNGFPVTPESLRPFLQALASASRAPQEMTDAELLNVAGGHYQPVKQPGNPPPMAQGGTGPQQS